MSVLKNPRHERFAQGIAKGLSGKAAYVEAGYRSTGNAAEVGAAKLVRNGKIAARIAELQARQVLRLDVTVESLVEELEIAREGALAARQYAAAINASIGKARLLGLLVDRQEVEQVQRKPLREPSQISQMSLTEWQEKFAPKGSVGQSPAEPEPKPTVTDEEEEVSLLNAIERAKEARRVKPTGL
ncbi:MAG: Terminase small subunit [Mesorhizobium sp.]|nr:MAG: Terminase small subunit [Mesorhizobium sp.]